MQGVIPVGKKNITYQMRTNIPSSSIYPTKKYKLEYIWKTSIASVELFNNKYDLLTGQG